MIDQLTAENFEHDFPLFIEHYKARFGCAKCNIEAMYDLMFDTPGLVLDMVEEMLAH
jgi:hypothetical protein